MAQTLYTNSIYSAKDICRLRVNMIAQSVTCLATDACLTADLGGRESDLGPVPYFRGD